MSLEEVKCSYSTQIAFDIGDSLTTDACKFPEFRLREFASLSPVTQSLAYIHANTLTFEVRSFDTT